MKKRVVGAVVLVIIGVALPLLLARCLQGDGEQQPMRVYEVAPDGETRPANETGNGRELDGASGVPADGERAVPDDGPRAMPEAVSPSSESDEPAGRAAAEPEPASQGEQGAAVPDGPTASTVAPQAASGSSDSLRQEESFGGGWVVQVASFTQEDYAERMARELNSEYKAFYRAGDGNGTTYYRVRVGPFENEASANTAAARLRASGHDTLVRRAQ